MKKNFKKSLKHSIVTLAVVTTVAMSFTASFFNSSKVLACKNLTKQVVPKNPLLPSPKNSEIAVDKNGFDSSGRMVAYFGSPVIDGKTDNVWKNAPDVTPKYVSNNIDTTATFKALWDDNALYILAEVKDTDLSVQSVNPYMQDSFEIFLDENNNKTQEYDSDDLHLRVNYENTQSSDVGDSQRFFTISQKTKDGYLIEARVGLNNKPANGNVLGIDLQINDAKNTERVGTINVFDSTGNAWNDTGVFGEVLFTGKTPRSITRLNPYDLMNLIKKAEKIDLTRYKNPNIITDAIKNAKKVLENKKVTQKQIDQELTALNAAMNKLIFTDEAANEKEFIAVPDEYRAESKNQGSIESLEYSTINLTNTEIKKLNVYLPYGYNASDSNKKYNILYLMHGGGENENTIFGGPGQNKELKRFLDNMIEKGNIEPLIVVTPTFYGGKNDTALFHEELVNTIIPLIETKYHTYAASEKPEDLKASREHRAFGGFSMGSVTTWYTYINCLNYFKYFIPLSGDCWAFSEQIGGDRATATAKYLADVAKNAGYGPKDYYLFCATGSLDIAYPNLSTQIDAMKQLKDSFIYSSDVKKGNFYFLVCDGGTHAWNWINQYLYNILPDLFQN